MARRNKRNDKNEVNSSNMSPPALPRSAFSSTVVPQHHLDPDLYAEMMRMARQDLWSRQENTVIHALEQFCEFCEPDTARGEHCRRALVSEGGVHALVIQRLQEADDVLLHAKGLELLFHLSSSPFSTIENALLFMGAVHVAVQAMEKFPLESEIQVYACVLIGNLINSPKSWNSIIDQVSRNSSSMADDDDNAQQNAQGSNGGDNRGHHDNNNDKPRIESRILAAVQLTQERHAENEKVQEGVAFLLERCLTVVGSRVLHQIIQSAPRTLNALLLAKQRFPNNIGIASRVKTFFQTLAHISDDLAEEVSLAS